MPPPDCIFSAPSQLGRQGILRFGEAGVISVWRAGGTALVGPLDKAGRVRELGLNPHALEVAMALPVRRRRLDRPTLRIAVALAVTAAKEGPVRSHPRFRLAATDPIKVHRALEL